jgi:RNA polymerase sigma factor (sigma-70 family)
MSFGVHFRGVQGANIPTNKGKAENQKIVQSVFQLFMENLSFPHLYARIKTLLPKTDKYNQFTDEELLARFQESRNPDLLGILLQRFTLLLFGVAMKYLKERDEAEDAVQAIFEKAIILLPTTKIGNLKGWLYVLIRNHCLQQLRSRQYLKGEEEISQLSAESTDINLHLEKEVQLEELEKSLNELTEEQRMGVRLFYMEKLSYQQIMDKTGWNYMQVKSHIQNGKRNLKLTLSRKGIK